MRFDEAPPGFGRGYSASFAHSREVRSAVAHMADFVAIDPLEDAGAGLVAGGAHPLDRRRGHVEAARLEHHRHHRQPRGDIVTGLLRRFPQAVVRGARRMTCRARRAAGRAGRSASPRPRRPPASRRRSLCPSRRRTVRPCRARGRSRRTRCGRARGARRFGPRRTGRGRAWASPTAAAARADRDAPGDRASPRRTRRPARPAASAAPRRAPRGPWRRVRGSATPPGSPPRPNPF